MARKEKEPENSKSDSDSTAQSGQSENEAKNSAGKIDPTTPSEKTENEAKNSAGKIDPTTPSEQTGNEAENSAGKIDPTAPAEKNLKEAKTSNYDTNQPSTSGLNYGLERNIMTHKIMEIIELPSMYSLYMESTKVSQTQGIDQPSTSGLNLQAGDSTTTHRNVHVGSKSSIPKLGNKLAKCSVTSLQHFSTPTMSATHIQRQSKLPVPIRTSKKGKAILMTWNAKLYKKISKLCDPIQEMPEPMPEMYPDEDEPEDEVVMSQVSDVQAFYERFTAYYEEMRNLDPALYEAFGMATEFERLNKELVGFLGELCYHRERRE